jgi:hypothetical protein
MEQLHDEFSKKLAEQQKQMAQFQVPYLVNHALFGGEDFELN